MKEKVDDTFDPKLNSFEQLLLRSSSQLEQADRLLTYLTTFLPGQTPSMELVSEAIVSCSAILQTYKNQALNKITRDSSKSLESKYLDAEFNAHKVYQQLAYALSVIKSTELLIEMTSSNLKGERGRWKAVVSLEAVKSALRLGMLCLSKRALPSDVPVHDVEADQDDITNLLAELNNKETPKRFDQDTPLDTPQRYRSNLLQPPDYDKFRPPIQLIRKLNPQLAISEVIAVLRPLVYAGVLYKYRDRRRSWTPWLVGVALEFASRQLSQNAIENSPKRRMTGLEKDLYRSRDRSFFWWLMRSKMYDAYTRNFLMAIVNRLMKWPVLNIGGRLLEDVLYLFDEYYFASATL